VNRDQFTKRFRKTAGSQLSIPLIALLALVIFNLIRDPSFFTIRLGTNNYGNTVLAGNLMTILNSASELVILSLGMTLVTSAAGGQDISIGAGVAIAGSIFMRVLGAQPHITYGLIVGALFAAIAVSVAFSMFNGVLVAVFRIQPMIATLVLYTCGRSIATWIMGESSELVINSDNLKYIGDSFPGIPIRTPLIIVALFILLFTLFLKFTNMRLYAETVGINRKTARLNGLNPIWITIISFMMLGVCVAVASMISAAKNGSIKPNNVLADIEMDAILAVAIGGNLLGGGVFSITGSVIGAYVIQMLTTTLQAMNIPSAAIKACKAVAILLIVVIGSNVLKTAVSRFFLRISQRISNKSPEVHDET